MGRRETERWWGERGRGGGEGCGRPPTHLLVRDKWGTSLLTVSLTHTHTVPSSYSLLLLLLLLEVYNVHVELEAPKHGGNM